MTRPLAGNSPGSAKGWYRMAPLADEHQQQTSRMIGEALELGKPASAILLGAGRCEELPLAELIARVPRIVLNDSEEPLLHEAIANATRDMTDGNGSRSEVEVWPADLIGVTDALVSAGEALVAMAEEPEPAILGLAELWESATPTMPKVEERFDLVVASCVLSQLYVSAMQRTTAAFEARYPKDRPRLDNAPRWKAAVEQFARRGEKRFIDYLSRLVTPTGQIYLSETVQVCFVRGTKEGDWLSEGRHRMTRTLDLTDELDERFREVQRGRWPYVFQPPQKSGDVGRLFDVQGMLLRLA